jgi:hypothetical protein
MKGAWEGSPEARIEKKRQRVGRQVSSPVPAEAESPRRESAACVAEPHPRSNRAGARGQTVSIAASRIPKGTNIPKLVAAEDAKQRDDQGDRSDPESAAPAVEAEHFADRELDFILRESDPRQGRNP